MWTCPICLQEKESYCQNQAHFSSIGVLTTASVDQRWASTWIVHSRLKQLQQKKRMFSLKCTKVIFKWVFSIHVFVNGRTYRGETGCTYSTLQFSHAHFILKNKQTSIQIKKCERNTTRINVFCSVTSYAAVKKCNLYFLLPELLFTE